MPELIISSFQTKYSEKSPCRCDCVNEGMITYYLQIKISVTTDILGVARNKWRAWFQPESSQTFAIPPERIGDYFEQYKTQEEAIAGAMKAKEEYLTT